MSSPIQCIVIAFIASQFLSACSVVPKNLDNNSTDTGTEFTRLVTNTDNLLSSKERAIGNSDINKLTKMRLSRGDFLKLRIASMERYDGIYQINSSGQLELPINETFNAAGLSREELITDVKVRLHKKKWFPDTDTLLDLSLVRAAPVDVAVHGAVFGQGRVTINSQPNTKQEDSIQHEAGTHQDDRNLVAAIRAAGGVRPDADLKNVILYRQGRSYSLDLTAIFSGSSFKASPSLIHGDEIHVPSKGTENTTLIRPSQITPPGMRILLSNLTAPSLNNALSAVGADSTRLPYGSSLLDGAISANCVGGTHQANASRTVLLVTRHYGSNQQFIVKRSINELLADSSTHSINPFLMPNDGIACYDSRFTNIRDVARGIGEIFGPLILRGLL